MNANDYLMLTFDYRTYGMGVAGTVDCVYAGCSLIISSSSVNIIKAVLSTSALAASESEIKIEGLKSYGSTTYTEMTISIESYTADGTLMDRGEIAYELTCSASSVVDKLCKTCDLTAKVCLTCYTE